MSWQPDKHLRDLPSSQRLALVVLGVGVLFPMFFVATVRPVLLPVAVQLGCLTALLLLLRRRWLGGSWVPGVVCAAGFVAASAAAYASMT